jgi:HpcH/HpaI aldolase/citrate lyase family
VGVWSRWKKSAAYWEAGFGREGNRKGDDRGEDLSRTDNDGRREARYIAAQQTEIKRFSMAVRPRRSVLYLPGDNERALEKSKSLAADSLIIDLEDSVAPDNKVTARDKAVAAIRSGGFGAREVILRVNALETPWGMADLHAALSAEPDAVLVPKVSQPGDIISTAKVVKAAGVADKVRLWAMIETPMGIINAREIWCLAPTIC